MDLAIPLLLKFDAKDDTGSVETGLLRSATRPT